MKTAYSKKIGLSVLSFLGIAIHAQHIYPPQKELWNPDKLGNKRAVVKFEGKSKVAKAIIPWRNPEVKDGQRILVVDSTSQKQYEVSAYLNINREQGEVLFDPVSGKGTYYIYYLPYELKVSENYPQAVYLRKTVSGTSDVKGSEVAKFMRIDAVDRFNENNPMEVLASKNEIDQYLKKHANDAYLVFPESRENPVKMNDLPQIWVDTKRDNSKFSGKTDKGEFYAFQLGILAKDTELKNVKIIATDLVSSAGKISASLFTSINTDGTSYEGKPLKFAVNVAPGSIQSIWCGFDIPADVPAGTYKAVVTIQPENAPAQNIPVEINISGTVAQHKGYDEPWKMTRLPWLNSAMAQENTVIKPYTPLVYNTANREISLLGRKVILSPDGLPAKIQTFFTQEMTEISAKANEVLASPVKFNIVNANGTPEKFGQADFKLDKKEEGLYSWHSQSQGQNLKMEIEGSLEFDGFMEYKVKVTALNDVELKDISMQIPFSSYASKYLMGLGEKGGNRPENFSWKWDVAKKNQDGAWLGNVNAGLQFSLRDEKYSRPLNTNFYLQKPLILPGSWGNNNKGGINITEDKSGVVVNNYSGSRNLKKGEELYYNFHLLITPFHTINTEWQWENRFYHKYVPIEKAKESGANVINIHHGTDINPYINYPFIATKEMKDYISKAHQSGLKVKIYNTIREVSNRMYELYPVRSLGHEVFSAGKGGGYSWLQEHLHNDYIAAWYVPEFKDAAIINSGMNRWHNYYVEGMNWLVDNIGIDGIYLDDVAFDRVTMKRVKKVMTKNGHPGIIDLHSANQFNDKDGFNNSANLYMEHFPYLNRLWFGEYFDYEKNKPDFFLTEVSGIPFGLMGEMLQNDGNLWRGMIFGMTNRLGWSDKSNPTHLWKAWDNFGIKGSKMIGYWVDNNPVKTDNKEVLATVYKKDHKVMVALASWASGDASVKLNIDWKKLGINPKKAVIKAQAIEGFQEAKTFGINDAIPIAQNKGWLLVIE
ncbi:TPA: glycoside hydrolase domain-containing protein [Elizabethkingia anophelis]